MVWKPGESGNPKGYHKLPEELRGIQILRPAVVHRVLARFAGKPIASLRDELLNPDASALDKAWIRQILLAADGDGKALDRVMLWAVGQPQAAPPEEAQGNLSLDNMTTAELLDVVRKSLPAARDLPELKNEQPTVSTSIFADGQESKVDPDGAD